MKSSDGGGAEMKGAPFIRGARTRAELGHSLGKREPSCVALSVVDADSSPDVGSGRVLAFAASGLLNAYEVRSRFGVPESRLARDVAAGRAFVVHHDGVDLYPSFLFDGTVDRRHLARVIRKLGSLDGWSKWHFFRSRRGSLNRATPLLALTHGDVAAVLRSAEAYVER